MTFRLNARDDDVLASIAEYRILTVRQLTMLHGRNTRALRRRLRDLSGQGLVQVDSQVVGRSRGRPEGLLSVTVSGADLLKRRGVLGPGVTPLRVTAQAAGSIPHLLLTNDFRVQLVQMEQLIPAVRTRFLSPLSPFLPTSGNGQCAIHEQLVADQTTGRTIEFTPDGVLAVSHAEVGRTLLFFLEVDMGTETLISSQPQSLDVRQKLFNYRMLYNLRAYQRYEALFGCELRGFRMLLLADSTARMAALSRLVRDVGAPDFVLITDRHHLYSCGVWAAIWSPGGLSEKPRVSILGSKLPQPVPLPAHPA